MNRQTTGAAETSTGAGASNTNVDGIVGAGENRDIETFNASDRSYDDITDNVIGGASAGGVAGTGGVSTNDVGAGKTSKSPLTER